MGNNLRTYLHDHLAGAQFATSLLADMARQTFDAEIARFASVLLREIEEDEKVAEKILSRLDAKPSMIKEASAWLAQKMGRAKFHLEGDRFSIFEALELLSIGILGKLALWKALAEISGEVDELQPEDFAALAERARDQHERVEQRRLALANSLIAQE